MVWSWGAQNRVFRLGVYFRLGNKGVNSLVRQLDCNWVFLCWMRTLTQPNVSLASLAPSISSQTGQPAKTVLKLLDETVANLQTIDR
jgi:hypothetical protein